MSVPPPGEPPPETAPGPGRVAIRVPPGLPDPGPEARAAVRPLLDALADAIQAAGGAIPLPRYLEICLYTPGLGYYSGPLAKLGAAGDFVTAPEVSPLFGRCVARQCREVLDTLGGGVVLEVGAGTGALAADVLLALGELGCLPRRYLVLEVSADLRARQAETLARRAPGLRDRVEWIDRLPTGPITGVILANEVLDAIPFHRVRREAGGLVELWVTLSDAQLAWAARAPSDPRLPVTLAAIESETGEPLPQGYETEIAPAREAWIRTLAGSLGRGLLLLSDYGFARREYYHPQRTAGTLACHYRHRMHADPLALPGLQDVTAHVDFTAVARAGVEAGLTLAGFVSQADFLIATGMLDDLAAAGDDWQRLELTSAAKRLALPALMGEAFKVLGLTRGLDRPLRGFGLRDRRGRLER